MEEASVMAIGGFVAHQSTEEFVGVSSRPSYERSEEDGELECCDVM